MHTSRLSKYTLTDIAYGFNNHPILIKLNAQERRTVYNQAQNEIAQLLGEVYQITNYTVANNKLTYTYSRERNIINALTAQEIQDLRLGTRTFSQLKALVDTSYDLSDDEKKFVLNLAQDVLARLKNDYDTLGYYQLWYNIDADVLFNEIKDNLDFYTTLTTSVSSRTSTTVNNITVYTHPDEVIGEVDFKATFTTSIGKISTTYVDNGLDFHSTFTALVAGVVTTDVDKSDLDFKTTFTTTVVADVVYTETEHDLDFHTTFTTAVA